MKITTLIENQAARTQDSLSAEHGLSMHLQRGEASVLFDTGASGAFAGNADRLGIRLDEVDAVVLSHHHFDHGGGLEAFFSVNDHAPVYLKPAPDGEPSFHAFGVLNRAIGLPEGLLEKYSDRFVFVDEPTEIKAGVFVLPHILENHSRPAGNSYLYLDSDGQRSHDSFEHELMMVVRSDEGIVVFTGCSHSGVLNMIDTAVEAFPGEPIEAVLGGFHLIGFPLFDTMAGGRKAVREVGEALAALPVEKFWTGHCTGRKAYGVLGELLGARLAPLNAGTVIDL